MDPEVRDKVNHPYLDVMPDVVRGKKVRFFLNKPERVSVLSPTFTKQPRHQGVFFFGRHLSHESSRRSFFLWLLSLFFGGAIARLHLGAQGLFDGRRNRHHACSSGRPLEGQEAGSRISWGRHCQPAGEY